MSDGPGGSAIPYTRAVETAKVSDDAALARLFGPVQLIGAPPEPAEDGGDSADEEWSYRTRGGGHLQASLRTGLPLWLAWIFPVRKARRGFFEGTILIGRAASSDVCIDHPSVSKLHARIKIGVGGTYTLADAGSRNGTWLSSRRLTEQDTPLAVGAMVKLGDWQLKFSRLDQTIALLRAP